MKRIIECDWSISYCLMALAARAIRDAMRYATSDA